VDSQTVPQLNPAAKRLLLSAHLSLVCKKLRRGLSVEEQEILALLPFTVSNGSQPDEELRGEICDEPTEDQDWTRRVAEAGALR
jgi:hypothetical protein